MDRTSLHLRELVIVLGAQQSQVSLYVTFWDSPPPNLLLVESIDEKPGDREGKLSGPHTDLFHFGDGRNGSLGGAVSLPEPQASVWWCLEDEGRTCTGSSGEPTVGLGHRPRPLLLLWVTVAGGGQVWGR